MSDCDEYAPTFDEARNTLAGMLDGWAFGRVTREVKRPDICKPYFHGMIVTPQKARVWFQHSNAARSSLQIGPIKMHPSPGVPNAGDVLMGRLDTSTQGERHRSRLMNWYSNAQPLQMLAKVCLEGTQQHEMQLMSEMRTESNDDVWGLCRLVLFGNIRAFADAHAGKRRGMMKLSTTPLEFVYSTAGTLGDETIWSAFVALVPDAKPPLSPPPSPLYCSPPRAPPSFHSHPVSFYTPTSPPYNPASPPYNPVSPPYNPTSPPYNPTSPPYNPTSPPYNPTSPPYNPTSPPYNPTSPSIHPPLPPAPDSSLSAQKSQEVSQMLELLNSYFPSGSGPAAPAPPPEAYDPLNPSYGPRL